jgi:hypothetical protein
LLAAAGEDTTVLLWEVAGLTPGKQVRVTPLKAKGGVKYAEPFVQKEVGLVDDLMAIPVKSI